MPDDEQDAESTARRAGSAGGQRQGERHTRGVPAQGRHEVAAPGPADGPGLGNWQEATVARPGLDDRGSVFFAAVEMTLMPMLVTDPNRPDNPIAFANRAFCDLTGYAREEVLGRNCRFLQGALTDRGTVRQIREALAERRPIAVEVLNYRKDGTPFWNALFIGPVFGPDGQLLHFFSSQFDATGRRDAEDALRRAQKMEAIGELAAGLAHDFNNALHVVLGNLGRVEARLPDGADVRTALGRAKRAGEHVAALTRQLLAFARRSGLQPQPVVLNTVLAGSGEALSRALGPGVELRFDLDPGLPSCVVDPARAEAALLGLLANARDAMPPPGGGRVTVRTGTVRLDEAAVVAGGDALKPGRYVALTVEDDGPGMPPEVLARAAEPFFTTKPGKGTGLGLATVHGFVRQSGGRLEIGSAPGRGTTVRLLFPAAPPRAEPAPAPSEAEAALDAEGGRERVLVVDDDAGVLDLAVHHLTALGYRVLPARSGEEALAVLGGPDAPRVDLLFTDVVMPGGMNGLVLAERARALRPGLRVLLASGYSDDLVARGTPTPGGGADVLAKPYRRIDLAERLRAALNRPGARPGAAGPEREG
jgi:PAS domain S-box-containing protein